MRLNTRSKMSNQFLVNLNKFVDDKGVIILDGGLSNQLSTYNYDFEKSEIWTSKVLLDRPDLIKRVHRDYLDAGSDLITTATYQLTFQKLREFGFKDRKSIHEIFELAIRLAEEAIDEFMANNENQDQVSKGLRPLVAISAGSYGAFLRDGNEYKGNYNVNESDLVEFHRERIEFIASKIEERPGERFVAFETIPSILEARALIKLVQEHDDLNAYMSFSVKNGDCLADGTPIEMLADLTKDVKQIFAIGINCVMPEFVEPILKRIKNTNTSKKILIYPNNGDVYDEKTSSFIPNSAKFNFIDRIKEWKENYDLKLIGGCCRIGPNEIRRIRSFFS